MAILYNLYLENIINYGENQIFEAYVRNMKKPIIKLQNETSWTDEASLEYHIKQYSQVKESTKSFLNFIQKNTDISTNKRVVDLGCGAGAATNFISSKLVNSLTIAIDSSPDLIQIAKENKSQNIEFTVGDLLDLPRLDSIDGVYSIHTLMCLPEFEKPLEEVLLKFKPNWFAISSLFYPGEISATTVLTENNKNRSVFYNTYSIPEIDRFIRKLGYHVSAIEYFEIPFDILPSDNIDALGTYTVNVAQDDKSGRLQISGPMLMNWYFLMITKNS